VFSIGRALDLLVPDIPESVEIKVKREYYLAKQALADNEVSASPSLCLPHSPAPCSLLGHVAKRSPQTPRSAPFNSPAW
jgi:anoctamin-7